MALNVNRSVQDPYYRYKMPRLVAKVEGKGNGVKTVIPNMVDIARALGRPPTYCCKYFGCELGAQTQFDFKNERYIVNGAHDASRLQDMLDGFIKKFVLCEKCDNPETVLKVKSVKQIVTASCKACGHHFTVDMRHKLSTFILRNPPEQDLNNKGTSITDGKKDKKDKGGKGTEGSGGNLDSTNGSGGSGGNDNEDDDDEQWSTDISAEAIRKRMEEDLSSGVKTLAMDDDMDKPESERINIFHAFLEVKNKAGPLDTQAVKDVFVEAERLEVTNKAPLVLCEVLLGNTEEPIKKIKTHKLIFVRFTNENQKAQKYLLGGIEKLIEMKRDALLPKVAVIFKTLYDEDILDEEVIIEWAKKVSKKYVAKDLAEKIHKNAAPFVTWLQEAEEESESDDSDVEVNFNDRMRGEGLVAQEVAPPPENGKKDGSPAKSSSEEPTKDDEDVDIDDI